MGYHEYSEFEVEIKNLTEEEKLWFDNILNMKIDLPLFQDEDDPEIIKTITPYIAGTEREFLFPQFDYRFNIIDNSLNIFASADIYSESMQVAKLLQDFVQRFRSDEVFSFHWVCWDNRGRGTYNGGAYIIYNNKMKTINLKEYIEAN